MIYATDVCIRAAAVQVGMCGHGLSREQGVRSAWRTEGASLKRQREQ